MSKLGTIGEIALVILSRVPEPHVAEAAIAIEAIVAAVHQAHVTAHQTSGGPVSLDDLKAEVRQAAAAAMEPWQRIHDRAGA